MVNWGDVPTWVTACVAFLALIGAGLAYRTQSEQLRLQRIQIAADMVVREREQANQVDIVVRKVDGAEAKVLPSDDHRQVYSVEVANNSKRPIRNVTARARDEQSGALFARSLDPERLYAPERYSEEFLTPGKGTTRAKRTIWLDGGFNFLVKVGFKTSFVWSPGPRHDIDARYPYAVRFTDDVGLHWEIGVGDLHLEKLAKRDLSRATSRDW